jgi:hypothetical protein
MHYIIIKYRRLSTSKVKGHSSNNIISNKSSRVDLTVTSSKMMRSLLLSKQKPFIRRFCSNLANAPTTAAQIAVPKVVAAPPVAPGKSSTLFERLFSFLVGTGIGFGSAFYYISEELRSSNEQFKLHLDKIDKRLASLPPH